MDLAFWRPQWSCYPVITDLMPQPIGNNLLYNYDFYFKEEIKRKSFINKKKTALTTATAVCSAA